MLNKAREIMKQRENMITEAKEVLVVLGATNEATIVNNQIVINKGKVVAIETTNDEYIEQLLKDLENRNKRIEELKALLEREQQLYKDLEFEANEEIDAVAEKRDKEIARLKAENEKLKNDFIIVNNDLAQLEVNYELVKQDLSNKVDRIDELELHVEELQDKIDMLKEELQYFDGKEEEYNNDVTGMEQDIKELEEKLAFKELLLNEFRENMDEKIKTIHELENKMEGMKFGYENKIAKLKEEANKPQIKIEVVDDPDFNDEPEKKPIAKEQPKTNKQIDMVLYDVHLTHDGCVRGYTKEYEFVWNKNSNVPAYKLNNSKKWMPMTKAKYAEALYIKEQLAHFFEQDKATKDITIKQPKEEKVVEEVPEIVVNVTNDQVEQQIEEEDPLAGADEMEFW